MDIKSHTITIGGQDLTLEIGRFAQRASAAVTARYGDTLVFASVVLGRTNEGLGYFPLSVEYEEKLFAGGKIKGSRWVKREGRPSDEAILKARVIDRTIRPLFPKGLVNEVQVVATILSADGENDADMPAMYAVSAALAASNIPWQGPVSAVRIGLEKATGELLVNPTYEQRDNSDLDLIVSGSQEAVVMVEAGANEVSEAKMLEAFKLAETENKRIATSIAEFAKAVGKTKMEFIPKQPDQEAINFVKKELGDQIPAIVKQKALLEPDNSSELLAVLAESQEEFTKSQIVEAFEYLFKKEARRGTIEDGIRPDGRKVDEIRPLTSEVGLLPRTHGSAMFKRGSTQALTITTLGAPSLNQLIENMEGEEEKRYIHHYIMPPYTVGETGRMGWPSRREIGHGALAERALLPMIPDESEFPYTIHVVSQLMSSNGSTSMASVCGSTLSLMDAGVPIKKPVAGIAMGLMVHEGQHIVLSDIQGLEDHTGDMDFKVAGTADGITAMQMDIKVTGIPFPILEQALEKARKARLFILEHMLQTLSAPRTQLSAYAPKIVTISIDPTRIGEVIGSGGKIIKGIIEDTGAQVDIEDDGSVFISATDQAAIDAARSTIEGILKKAEVGEEYDGTVVRLMNFGAFVNILPGKDGMIHVSKMGKGYVADPSDVLTIGDEVRVRVIEVDDMGRINLELLSGGKPVPEDSRPPRSAQRPPRDNRGGDRRRSGGGRDNHRSNKPHFEYRDRD